VAGVKPTAAVAASIIVEQEEIRVTAQPRWF
jgi:hypothetical protein